MEPSGSFDARSRLVQPDLDDDNDFDVDSDEARDGGTRDLAMDDFECMAGIQVATLAARRRQAFVTVVLASALGLVAAACFYRSSGPAVASGVRQTISFDEEDPAPPKQTYRIVEHSFCQNQPEHRRLNHTKDDAVACQKMCDENNDCNAFEIFFALGECSLLSECSLKSSMTGSYVMFKNRTTIPSMDLLTAAMGAMHDSPGDEPEQPQLGGLVFRPSGPFLAPRPMARASTGAHGVEHSHFDCRANVAQWQTAWSAPQKDYCCNYYYDGCPDSADDSHHPLDGHMPYDCQADISTWESTWSPGKKSWCCSIYYDGCPSSGGPDCEADLRDWPTRWTPEKKQFCCHNAHVGCDLEDMYGPEFVCHADMDADVEEWDPRRRAWCCAKTGHFCPDGIEAVVFVCGQYSEDFRSAWDAWSEQKQAWCCVKEGIACPAPPATTTPFSDGEISTSTPFPDKYDCDADFGCWGTCWSEPKKEWCCTQKSRGCSEITNVEMTTTTPFPEKEGAAPETTRGWEQSPLMTTTTPFPSEAATTAGWTTPARAAPAMTTTTPFLLPSNWNPVVLPVVAPLLPIVVDEGQNPMQNNFDCNTGFDNWMSVWSSDQKAWCCEFELRGCPGSAPSGGGAAVAGTTTLAMGSFNCYVEAPSVWSDLKMEWCCKYKGCCDSGCPQTTVEGTFDCEAGIANWETEWFEAKKAWCCERRGQGCQEPGQTTRQPQSGASTTTGMHLPEAPASTTVVLDTDLTPRVGWEEHESTTCKEALLFMQDDECDAEVLLKSIQRTCPVKTAAAKEACTEWFGNIAGMSEADRQSELQRCRASVEKTAQAASRMAEVKPTSAEEAALCFKCIGVKCYSKNKPTERRLFTLSLPSTTAGPGAGAGGKWSPDGSGRHCRPRAGDGEVNGVQKRSRKEAHSLTDAEWWKLTSAMSKMQNEGKLEKYVRLFSEGMPPQDPTFMNFQNLPWYRHFIFDFETELQVVAKDCDLTLPYWSACSEASTPGLYSSAVWKKNKLGGAPSCQDALCATPGVASATQCEVDAERWCLGDGIAAHWKVTSGAEASGGCSCVHRSPGTPAARAGSCATVGPVLRMMEDFKSLAEAVDGLRATLHCGQAVGAKSTMCAEATAPWDPLFWLDYAFLDRIFFSWQRHHHIANDIDSTDCYGCEMHMMHYHEPLSEWFGKHDAENGCIMVPKSDPQACISYENAEA